MCHLCHLSIISNELFSRLLKLRVNSSERHHRYSKPASSFDDKFNLLPSPLKLRHFPSSSSSSVAEVPSWISTRQISMAQFSRKEAKETRAGASFDLCYFIKRYLLINWRQLISISAAAATVAVVPGMWFRFGLGHYWNWKKRTNKIKARKLSLWRCGKASFTKQRDDWKSWKLIPIMNHIYCCGWGAGWLNWNSERSWGKCLLLWS